jgi:hypothetical protein
LALATSVFLKLVDSFSLGEYSEHINSYQQIIIIRSNTYTSSVVKLFKHRSSYYLKVEFPKLKKAAVFVDEQLFLLVRQAILAAKL